MAKRRGKRQDSPLWQWLLVAAVAFGLYKGIDYYLNRKPEPTPGKVKTSAPTTTKPSPAPETQAGPITEWTFQAAKKFLPEQAYPDNFRPIPLDKDQGALLAFAKKIQGKEPGPQGLTHTQPGLQVLRWDGKQYQSQEIDFAKLAPALGEVSWQKLEGLPQFNQTPVREENATLYPVRLFLQQDNREILVFLEVQGARAQWAQLKNPIGKRMPALFILGTTANDSRKFRQQKVGGRHYLILEIGSLDPIKTYEGYQWQVQAYYWDGQEYVYDGDFSQKLTESKKSSH